MINLRSAALEAMAKARWEQYRGVLFSFPVSPWESLTPEHRAMCAEKEAPALDALLSLPGIRVVPNWVTSAQVAAGLDWTLKWMDQNNIDALSPFRDYPLPSATVRGCYNAMIAAAPNPLAKGDGK